MDKFPNPGIAQGIFFEYLRFDDPISKEARDRAADGFPFLLAPLAQVKGVSSPKLATGPRSESLSEDQDFGLVRAASKVADSVSLQMVGFTKWMRSTASSTAGSVGNITKSAVDSARAAGGQMEKRAVSTWKNAVSFPENSMNFLSSKIQEVTDSARTRNAQRTRASVFSVQRIAPTNLSGVLRPPMTRWLSVPSKAPRPDEIGPIIHPAMNPTRIFFLVGVHLYLLLLLIVSLPGSHTRRMRLVRKVCSNKSNLESDCDDTSGSEEEGEYNNNVTHRYLGATPRLLARGKPGLSKRGSRNKMNVGEQSLSTNDKSEQEGGTIKKSLSYYL